MKKATLGQGKQVLDLLLEHGSLEEMDEILASGILSDIFKSGLDREAWKKLRAQFKGLMDGVSGVVRYLIFQPITVNYNFALEVMVRAGKYDRVNSDITEKHFSPPRRGEHRVELQLIHFNRSISSDDAARELDEMGLRPATLWEFLAFGAIYPEEQRKYPMVALGSSFQQDSDGRRVVPCLWSEDSVGRGLHLRFWHVEWYSDFRFAAVRKAV